jgi:Uma2 family endonuclease
LWSLTTARRLHHSYDDYLRALEVSGVKLEYCEGEIYAMAGGTPAHADLAAAITRLLGNALLTDCRVSSSDLKVRLEATDLSTFPDVTVVCGARQVAASDKNAVTNPTLLVEVTSNSTEDYDRGEKLNHYKQCRSLKAVLFVSHRRAQVTVVARSSAGWEQREYRAGERVEVTEPRVELAVDELYRGIELEEA